MRMPGKIIYLLYVDVDVDSNRCCSTATIHIQYTNGRRRRQHKYLSNDAVRLYLGGVRTQTIFHAYPLMYKRTLDCAHGFIDSNLNEPVVMAQN